jgi:hypothetical protein
MKRLLTLAAVMFFAAGSAQAACPAHPGYMLNGNVTQLSGLQVICGPVYNAFKGGYSGSSVVKWVELYGVKNNADPSELARKVNSIFTGLGFIQIQHKSPSSTEQIFGYLNASTKKIISMYIFVNQSIVYLSFSGN